MSIATDSRSPYLYRRRLDRLYIRPLTRSEEYSHLYKYVSIHPNAKAVSFRDISSLALSATIITKTFFLSFVHIYISIFLALDRIVTNTILEENNNLSCLNFKKENNNLA